MSKRKKRQSYHPANDPSTRYRVVRSDGVILAEALSRENAEEIAKGLNERPEVSMTYQVKRDSGRVIDLRQYLSH